MPKISVIIPVYNVEKYLSRCLDSVINQTLEDIEIICVNDCSTDGSLAILREYAAKDNRIKLIDLSQNRGAANARNIGIDNARGEYIGFIDPDDFVDLNFYEELYNKAINTNADIVKCDLITIEFDKSKTKGCLNNLIKNISKFYFSYEYTSAIYRAFIIFDNKIKFPEELVVGEDDVFLHKCILKSKKVEVIDKTHYYYIRRLNSLNAYIYDFKRMEAAISTIEYMADNYNDSFEKDITKEEYLVHYNTNMFILINYTITKTNNKKIKYKCVEKFVDLFKRCKMQKELENIFEKKYPKVLDLIKKNKIKELFEMCTKYQNFQRFCIMENIQKTVKRDMKNEKSISNNSCI